MKHKIMEFELITNCMRTLCPKRPYDENRERSAKLFRIWLHLYDLRDTAGNKVIHYPDGIRLLTPKLAGGFNNDIRQDHNS